MTEAEAEDYHVHKRRSEGTPCNKENFEDWKERFDAEMEEQRVRKQTEIDASGRKNKEVKVEDKSGRLTGFQHFSGAAANLQALEAAADEAERDNTPFVDEELFDDDEDLDDLDFDSDEDLDDDDDDDEDDYDMEDNEDELDI
jgi:hypothetical protein